MGIRDLWDQYEAREADDARASSVTSDWEAYAADKLNPDSPNYIGPGYQDLGRTDASGNRVLTLTDPQAQGAWKLTSAAPVPTNPSANTADLLAQAEGMAGVGQPAAPARPQPTNAEIGAARGVAGSAFSAVTPRGTAVARPVATGPYGAVAPAQSTVDKLRSVNAAAPPGTAGAGTLPAPAPAVPTAAGAPQVDRAAVNAALAPVNQIGGMLTAEALQNSGAGLAESQLRESTARARSAALGAARSGNRRDRAMQERQAIGEGAFLEQEGNRQAATIRAQEELQNRQFRVDTLSKAGELGLNVAAYEVDISKANLASASSFISEQFQQLGLDKQLDMQLVLEQMGLAEQRYATDTQAGMQAKQLAEQRFQNVLGFTRDMAAIQLQYDQLAVQDQNEADALMMQKYGIDQQTMTALKQIKEAGKFRWDNVLAGLAGGAGMGATGALGKLIG
jgi:hypothetical protein